MNALSSGFFALSRLLPGESQNDYDNLSQSLIAELDPQSAVEQVIVDHIVSDIWRLRRLERAENSKISEEILARAKRRKYASEIEAMRDADEESSIEAFLKNAPDPACSVQDVDQVLGIALSRGISNMADIDRIRTGMMRRIVQSRVTLGLIQEQRMQMDSEAAELHSNEDFVANGSNESDHYLT
jgi:hypothetical protein